MGANKGMYSSAAAIGSQYQGNKEVQHEAAGEEIQGITIAAGIFPEHCNNGWSCNSRQSPGSQNSSMDGAELPCAKQIGEIGRHTGEATTIAAYYQ